MIIESMIIAGMNHRFIPSAVVTISVTSMVKKKKELLTRIAATK